MTAEAPRSAAAKNRRQPRAGVTLAHELAPGTEEYRGRGRPTGVPSRPGLPPRCGRCGTEDAADFHQSKRAECRDCLIERAYGLNVGAYRRMMAEQGGVCWICSSDFGGRELYVDHCHETGAVRGLLCSRCNTGLSFVERNRDRLDVVLQYLDRGHWEAS